jgi:hypothetical protein
MIDVEKVLGAMPGFGKFCSVAEIHALVADLQRDSTQLEVNVVGQSVNGLPIHHIRTGHGAVKALFVGFPHCMEPIGGITASSLLMLLHRGHRELLDADVEWHIVPCIDPDGALLNEGWTQQPFTFDRYMKNFYVQGVADQVDTSFPIAHKNLVRPGPPSPEGRVLQSLLEKIRPDFFFTLHNAWVGGAFYFVSRDLPQPCQQQIRELMADHGVPVQRRPLFKEMCASYGEGFIEIWSVRNHYDFLERTIAAPEEHLPYGAGSWDYLAQIKPDALTFAAELGYLTHPWDESERPTGRNLRQFKLRLDADSKYLATVVLEEWERLKPQLDPANPFYRAIVGGTVLPEKAKLVEGGLPLSLYPTSHILFNPQYDKSMTEGDLFNACVIDGGFFFLRVGYQFVRLLKTSPQTDAVRQAIQRLDTAFDEGLRGLGEFIDLGAFKVTDCNTLARVQLGSGLIALNSILAERRKVANVP